MGTIPTITTFSAGAVLTAAMLNQVKTVSDFWAGPPACLAYHSTLVSLPNSPTITVIPLQSELYDMVQSPDPGMHDNVTNNSRLIFRTAGKYQVSGQINFAANTVGRRTATVRLNAAGSGAGGTSLLFTSQGAAASGTTPVPIPVFYLAASIGDYIEMFASQDSGGALNTVATQSDTFLTARLVAA